LPKKSFKIGKSLHKYQTLIAQKFHARRSTKAKRIDEGLRAPLAKSTKQWLNQPNRFDLPDVDTPKQAQETSRTIEPQRLTHSQIKQRLSHHRRMGVTH
jgi:hypothetical protein